MNAAYDRAMPRTSKNEQAWEYFRFAVEAWNLEYSFRVSPDSKPDDPLGICAERCDLIVSGPLRSKTRRRCERVILTVSADGIEPKNWNPKARGFGRVIGVREGALTGWLRIPPASFQAFATALAAGKVRGLYVHLNEVERGAGFITHFFTIDPDEPDE